MTKVCRLCLVKLQRGSKYFNINAVESFTGFMPYRDQLTTCIPEMALDLIPNPVICNNCRSALKSSYQFKSRCLLVEKKIRQYVESHPQETTTYNLLEIDSSNLPKPLKFEAEGSRECPKLLPLLPKMEAMEAEKASSNPSILSNLLTVREEVILPNLSEIEITNIKYEATPEKEPCNKSKASSSTKQVTYTPIEKDEDGRFTCNHCDKKFPNVPALHTHKTRVHEEDYLCNFCNVPFKTLQNLRKHNQMCQKAKFGSATPSHSVLAKRPHLPTKAKNHLKRWLFNHTDHPYPTDVEKQQLMKETNLSLLQVENWFINARRRILADLTRLKNMRGGGYFRGRRLARSRGRGRVFVASLEDELFEDDNDALFEDEHEETVVASQLIQDLQQNESKMSFESHRFNSKGHSFEDDNQEMSDKDDDEDAIDVKNIIIQNPIEIASISPIDHTAGSAENSDEEDPLEDVPLSSITSHIKMEIDIDER